MCAAAKSKPGKDAPGLSLEDIASRVDTMPRAGLIAILKTEVRVPCRLWLVWLPGARVFDNVSTKPRQPNTDESSLEALSLAKLRKRAREVPSPHVEACSVSHPLLT